MQRLPPPPLPDWLAAMVPFERYVVDIGGWKMHVMEQGEGRPVFMLHGNPTWGFLYRKVALALKGEPLRVIMPDLIGLGWSDKPRDLSMHTIRNHSTWIGDLIDRMDLRGMVFVGQDWGGPIGLHALVPRRDRLAGMVLMNTVAGPPRPGFTPTPFHRLSQMPLVSDLLFRGFGFPQRGMNFAQGDKRSIRGNVARAYAEPLRGLANNAAPLALARMVPDTLNHPSCTALKEVEALVSSWKGPAAIVWGDRDPVLGRTRSRMERLLPQAPVTRTEAGHFLQEEAPDAIAEAVRNVVAQIV